MSEAGDDHRVERWRILGNKAPQANAAILTRSENAPAIRREEHCAEFALSLVQSV